MKASPSKTAKPKPVATPVASPRTASPTATPTPVSSTSDGPEVPSAEGAVPASDVRAARGTITVVLITLGALTLLFGGAAILVARRRRARSG